MSTSADKDWFPDHWIAPGEFSFCGSCGEKSTLMACSAENRPRCELCNHHRMSDKQRIVAKHLHAAREELASYRRDIQKLPPLFWMKDRK